MEGEADHVVFEHKVLKNYLVNIFENIFVWQITVLIIILGMNSMRFALDIRDVYDLLTINPILASYFERYFAITSPLYAVLFIISMMAVIPIAFVLTYVLGYLFMFLIGIFILILVLSLINESIINYVWEIMLVIVVILLGALAIYGTIRVIEELKRSFTINIDKKQRFLTFNNTRIGFIPESSKVTLKRELKKFRVAVGLSFNPKVKTIEYVIWTLSIDTSHGNKIIYSNEEEIKDRSYEVLASDFSHVKFKEYWDWMHHAANFIAYHLNLELKDETGYSYDLQNNSIDQDIPRVTSDIKKIDQSKSTSLLTEKRDFQTNVMTGRSNRQIYEAQERDISTWSSNNSNTLYSQRNKKNREKSQNLNKAGNSDKITIQPIQEGYEIVWSNKRLLHWFYLVVFILLTILLGSNLIIIGIGLRQIPDKLFNIMEIDTLIINILLIVLLQYSLLLGIFATKRYQVTPNQINVFKQFAGFKYNKITFPASGSLYFIHFNVILEIVDSDHRLRLPGTYGKTKAKNITQSIRRIYQLVQTFENMIAFDSDNLVCYSCGRDIDAEKNYCTNCEVNAPNCVFCYVDLTQISGEEKMVRYLCCKSIAHYSHAMQWNSKNSICPYCKSEQISLAEIKQK